MPIQRGDVVTIETSGGGGFGDPLKRDRKALARDLAEGLVSEAAAREYYGWTGEKSA